MFCLYNYFGNSQKSSKNHLHDLFTIFIPCNRFYFVVVGLVVAVFSENVIQRCKNINEQLHSVLWVTFMLLPHCNIICRSVTKQTMAKLVKIYTNLYIYTFKFLTLLNFTFFLTLYIYI